VPARLRAGQRSYLTSLVGLPPDSQLRQPHDALLNRIAIASDGITMTRRLAERLGLQIGQNVTVEVMEGRRRIADVPVNAIADDVIGMLAYMELGTLNGLTAEGNIVSAASLFVEPSATPQLLARFKELPVIAAVAMKSYSLRSFLEKIADLILVISGILTVFAVIIAVGIVYNSARIGFQERARELASLRVLGFTASEVSRVFFAEFVIEIAAALPLGVLLAQLIVDLISRFHPSETFQIPGVVSARTFIASCAIVLVAALVSAFIVRRRIYALDLVATLKVRD
jgi:putative ABC transport system permease protein